ncbi:MAG TPA: hypothetical protein VF628_02200 [Allosphingosinicella sp.]|jgi:hypothetical protein
MNAQRKIVADPDFVALKTVMTVRGRDGQPWFMFAFRSGSVGITNAPIPPSAIRLFRFATAYQALAAGGVIEAHARLARDGEVLLVPGVVEACDDEEAIDALIAWHDRIAPLLEQRLAGQLTGFYSMRARAGARS